MQNIEKDIRLVINENYSIILNYTLTILVIKHITYTTYHIHVKFNNNKLTYG